MTPVSSQKKCYLYLINTLSDWEIGYITAELHSGRYFAKDAACGLITVGSSLQAVTTMGGFSVTPDKLISDLEFQAGDMLLLPGADTWMDEANKVVLDMVPDLLEKGVVVAAICGATLALAQNGVLDNRKHTSNAKQVMQMFCPDYRGASHYIEKPAVVDDLLITASGLAPLEFSYEVFKKLQLMKEQSLEAWYQLYRTKDAKYFHELMESLK